MGTPVVERRQITVMFCDLVGSTELSTKLDPEPLESATNAYLKFFAEQIETAGGFVARYSGDGILAYFGYPTAHENDAERAIHAGLRIMDGRLQLPMPLGQPLSVRIGIATGLAVVGNLVGKGSTQERTAIGETPNLAARLQSMAAPNTIVVSNATRQLGLATFRFRDLGIPELKGLSLTEPVWEVVAAKDAVERFQARQELGLAPLMGRESELKQILDRWRRCIQGDGGHIRVVGPAGIGKSRLLHEAHRIIARSPHIWLETGNAQIFDNTPLYAIAQMIRRRLARNPATSNPDTLANLRGALRQSGVDNREALTLVAELIGCATPEISAELPLSADGRREQLLEVLAHWLLSAAKSGPTVMVVEDVHWADPSTVEFLNRISRSIRSAPVLLLTTSRREDVEPAGTGDDLIVLGGLTGAASKQIVRSIAGESLSETTLDLVSSRAGGVPLYAEELARFMVQTQGATTGKEMPPTLSDLLMMRLDALGPARRFLQLASVLGHEFQLPLFAAVSRLASTDIRQVLASLTEAGLIRRDSDDTYVFSHSLFRESAYGALLKSQRKAMHKDVGDIIERDFAELAAERPEILAHHWTAAGEALKAIRAWRDAARLAGAKRAYAEAERAYRAAIEMAEDQVETVENEAQELELRIEHAGVLQVTQGYSAPSTREAIASMRRLVQKGGDLQKQYAHVSTALMAASSAADYPLALRFADQLLPLAWADGSSGALGVANALQMTARYRMGDLAGAEETFKTALNYFRSPEFHARQGAPGQTFGNAALIASILGELPEAERRMEYGLEVARATGNPYEESFALYIAAVVAIVLNDNEKGAELAGESMRISRQHGFPQFVSNSHLALGRAMAALGAVVQGLEEMQLGLEQMRANKVRSGMTMYLTWFAEVHASGGDSKLALESFSEALQFNPHELFYRPETLRLKAEAHARIGEFDAAMRDCQESIRIAKSMGARLFHDRAIVTLAKLYQ